MMVSQREAQEASTRPKGRLNRRLLPRWYLKLGTASAYFVAILIALTALVTVLAVSRSLTIPLVLALAIAMTVSPAVNKLEDRGVSRNVGTLVTMLAIVGLFFGAALIVGVALQEQGPELRTRLDEAKTEIEALLEPLPISAEFASNAVDGAQEAGPVLRDGVLTVVASALDTAIGVVAGILLGLVFLYYLLKDGPLLGKKLLASIAAKDRDPAAEAGRYANSAMRNYFASRTALSLVNAVVITLGMLIIGVPSAVSVGVVNFVGGYVPYVGAFVGGAFAVLLGLSEGGLGLALGALGIVLFVQLAVENVVEPKLVGDFVDLHPLVVLVVTILGGTFAGFVGLILAVPVTTITIESVRILRRHGYFDDDEEATAWDSHAARGSRG